MEGNNINSVVENVDLNLINSNIIKNNELQGTIVFLLVLIFLYIFISQIFKLNK